MTIATVVVTIITLLVCTVTHHEVSAVAIQGGCTFVTQRVQCRSLTCNETSGLCIPCTADDQCYQKAYGCFDGQCELKPLSETFTVRTLLAPLAGFIVCAIAVLAGVGGGAILGPLFNVILQIPFSDAVALSQCAIVGQSLLNVAIQIFRTHRDHSYPKLTRPNINYEYCCLLLPIAISGTYIGAVGNKISPNWLRVVLLLVVFSNALYRLVLRMLNERKANAIAAATGTKRVSIKITTHMSSDDDESTAAATNPVEPPHVGGGTIPIVLSREELSTPRSDATTHPVPDDMEETMPPALVGQGPPSPAASNDDEPSTPPHRSLTISHMDDLIKKEGNDPNVVHLASLAGSPPPPQLSPGPRTARPARPQRCAIPQHLLSTDTVDHMMNYSIADTMPVVPPPTMTEKQRRYHVKRLMQHPGKACWVLLLVLMVSVVAPNWLRIVMLSSLVFVSKQQTWSYIRRQRAAHAGEEEKPQFPFGWMALSVSVVVIFTCLSYISNTLIECGSALYFSTLFIVPAVGVAMTFAVRMHLARLYAKVQAGILPACVVPFEWSTRTTIVFPMLCIVAGFAATMLGIGGGLVLSSLLLEAGLAAGHASATSGLCTLLIAMQSVVTLIIGGKLRLDYGLLCFASGTVSTLFGRFVLLREIERRDATYLIIAALAVIMAGSMIAIVAYGIANTIKIYEHDGSLGFGPLCSVVTAAVVSSLSS